MNVLMVSPGFPAEMPWFARGLARVGARVLGVGEQPERALPVELREDLAGYLHVECLWDEPDVLDRVRRWTAGIRVDRVECLWEPAMMLAARMREAVGVVGMSPAGTELFRDKERMKQVLDRAGIRTPRHALATSWAECRTAAERIGFPLIVKPVAGGGSADTHRVNDAAELDRLAGAIRRLRAVSVEEYIEGEEYTFDTITVDGHILYFNVSWYRPRPLIGRSVEWLSPQTVTLKDVGLPHLQRGRVMGRRVLDALGFRTGFTHMEWFLKPDGEVVFGEIAARPPGARTVALMNYACDIDVFTGWAEAACKGRFSQIVRRKHNVAVVFKRAHGRGRIQRVDGLDHLLERYGPHVVNVDLLPVGAPRRDWRETLVSDGYVIVRHPNLDRTLAMADHFATDLNLYAA